MPIGLYNTQPIPGFRPPASEGVVKGYRTTATPRLTPERVLQLLAENTPEPAKSHFGSFYSSALGGIVTEPGFMLVSIDDAMVNKGDAVYESVSLSEGYLYKLDARVARFLDSADLAGIPLPFSEERLRRVLLDTAAASLKMNGMLTFWLSRGRGGLGLSQSNGSTFYTLLSTETCHLEVDRSAGIRAVTTPVDPRSPYFCAMRNVSQVENAVAHYEALARGADLAVFVDSDGTVLYGSNCSIGLLTTDNTLVLPPDEDGLANFGVQELAAHTLEYVKDEPFLTVERIEQRTFTVQEMLAAQEAFAVSTQIGVIGITHFDEQQIGTHEFEGEAGAVSMALNELLAVQRQPKEGSPAFTEVPYGYLTGMKSQLV